jgi:glutamyl-tRNA reductase
MLLVAAGLNHRTAPVDLRERADIPAHKLHERLKNILTDDAVHEALLLATCNRSEIYAVIDDKHADTLQRIAISHLEASAGSVHHEFDGHTYFYQGDRATEHLMRVAASLDSMMLGEYQILGQVRTAYEAAQEASATGPILNSLFQSALALGKKVRSTTSIGRGAFSIGAAAVELSTQIFGESLAGKTVLVLGAGEMGELTARHVHSRGAPTVIVTNRTFEHASELARKIGSSASAVGYDELPNALLISDIVICSTSAPHAVVTRPMIQTAMHARRNRPLFLVDIAVPRDIEPSVGDLENVYLYNIDDLSQVVARDHAKRQIEALKAEELIADAVDKYRSSRLSSEAGALISAVSATFADLMESELLLIKQRHPDLTDRELKLIEESLRSVTGKLSHDVIMTIRDCAKSLSLESQSQIEAIRAVFAEHPDSWSIDIPSASPVEGYEAKLSRLRSEALAWKER